MVDDRDPVATLGFLHQMGCEEDGHVLLIAQPVECLPKIDPRAGIEPGGRFVEQQEFRPMEQTLRDLDPPLQSAGERLDQIVGAIAQVELDQEMIDPLAQRGPGEAVEMPLMREVLAHPQFLVEARRLKDDAEPAAQGAGIAQEVEPENAGRAARRPNEGGENAEEGRLAAAVRPEQAEDFARRDAERDVVEREAVAIAMGEVARDERRDDGFRSSHEENGSGNAGPRRRVTHAAGSLTR